MKAIISIAQNFHSIESRIDVETKINLRLDPGLDRVKILSYGFDASHKVLSFVEIISGLSGVFSIRCTVF